MKFTELMRAEKQDLIVSSMHEEWLASNANPVYTAEALDFIGRLRRQQWRAQKSHDLCRIV